MPTQHFCRNRAEFSGRHRDQCIQAKVLKIFILARAGHLSCAPNGLRFPQGFLQPFLRDLPKDMAIFKSLGRTAL